MPLIDPLPQTVKDVLARLPAEEQAVLRQHITDLRQKLKTYIVESEGLDTSLIHHDHEHGHGHSHDHQEEKHEDEETKKEDKETKKEDEETKKEDYEEMDVEGTTKEASNDDNKKKNKYAKYACASVDDQFGTFKMNERGEVSFVG